MYDEIKMIYRILDVLCKRVKMLEDVLR